MISFPRPILSFVGGLLLMLFETGFLASLPGPLRLTPIVLAVGTYVVQLRGWRNGLWLIALFGVCLDVLGIAPVPLQTLAYGAAAAAVAFSSERLFSNRSLYGILGCGLMGWAAWAAVQTIVWLLTGLGSETVSVGAYAAFLAWRLGLLFLCLTALFYAIPRRTRITVRR